MNKKDKKKLYYILGVILILLIVYNMGLFKSNTLSLTTVYESPLGKTVKTENQELLSIAVPCESGYDYCRENTYTYGDAVAYAKISVSDMKAVKRQVGSGYFVGGGYISFKGIGDKFYLYKNLPSWSSSSCDETGCSSSYVTSIGSNYRFDLPVGQSFTDCFAFEAWDSAETPQNYAWTSAGTGYLGSNCWNNRAVACYDSTDCDAGYYCDKSTSWQNWNCKVKECDILQNKCVGTDYYTCSSTFSWQIQGKIDGKCGYTSPLANSTYYRYNSNLNKCDAINLTSANVNPLTDFTTLSECQINIKNPKTLNINYTIWIIVGIIVLIIVVVLYVRRR